MKRLIVSFVSIILFACVANAQYFTGFSIQSYRIVSAWPTSLRSVKGSVDVVVGNTGDERAIQNIVATVYRNGKPFASGVCENVTFAVGTDVKQRDHYASKLS